MTSTTGISMAGTLKNMLATGFSTDNCITELIDDSLGAGATHVRLTLEEGRLLIADNGCGMTCEQLRTAHVLNNRSVASATKHGRFGIGRKHALVGLTQILAPVRTLTRAADGSYSQIDINYPGVLLMDTMELNAHEMTMSGNAEWVACAIDAAASGTVTVIPLAPAKAVELRGLLTATHVQQSLLYALGLTYHRLLSSVTLEVVVAGVARRVQGIDPLAGADDTATETLKIYRVRASGEVHAYYESKGKMCRYYLNPESGKPKEFHEYLPASDDYLGDVVLRSAYMDDWLTVQNPLFEAMGLQTWGEHDKGVQEVRPFLGGTFIRRNGKIIHRTPAVKPKSDDRNPNTIKSAMNSRHVIEFTPVTAEVATDDVFTLDDVFNVQINKSKIDVEEIQKDVARTCQKHFNDFHRFIKNKLPVVPVAPVVPVVPVAPAPVPVPAPVPAPIIIMPEQHPLLSKLPATVPRVVRAATVAVVPMSDRRLLDDLEGFAAFLSTVDFEKLKKEASHHIRVGNAGLAAGIADLIEFVNDHLDD